MFSITAINDEETGGQWESLAPSKEAQEFRLSQNYHDGLVNLHAKNFTKAQELLESVLKDPLVSGSEGRNSTDNHLRQLRFLSLKNLASVFLQQGDVYYDNALQCYLQAIEIDDKDTVVWNQLGTLSCSMGLLSTSRWAFEQGVMCSPNNWNCMEKLLEVLIAIGDEVSCLSVADLILRHWPSHSRALHVKNIIECEEQTHFAPRGIDKLVPKHARLLFSEKRKRAVNITEKCSTKRQNQNIEIHLSSATWAVLSDAVLDLLITESAKEDEGRTNGPGMHGETTDSEVDRDSGIIICLSPKSPPNVKESLGEDTLSLPDYDPEKVVTAKEQKGEEDQLKERRITRLGRLRSRKPEKEEMDLSGKDPEKMVLRLIEPFILKNSYTTDSNPSQDCGSSSDVSLYSSNNEFNDVKNFVAAISQNHSCYHIAFLLLEDVAKKRVPFQSFFDKLLCLEKFIRSYGQDRSLSCTLFLAELYYDHGLLSDDDSKRSEFLLEASYHLCKIIELISLDFDPISAFFLSDKKKDGSNVGSANPQFFAIQKPSGEGIEEAIAMEEKSRVSREDSDFWVRFFWLSGCLSISHGGKKKAIKELSISLSMLKTLENLNASDCTILLPHCRVVGSLNVDRLQHQLSLLRVDSLLKKATKLTKKGKHRRCIDILLPLFLTPKDVSARFIMDGLRSVEVQALDVLLFACEKEEPMDIEVYLCYLKRKLQILTFSAGMINQVGLGEKSSGSTPNVNPNAQKNWEQLIYDEVKAISRNISRVRSNILQGDFISGSNAVIHNTIGEIQSHLVLVMCDAVRAISNQKVNTLGAVSQPDQLKNGSLVDSAIAFCQLQHLDPSVTIKAQVELIVAVHDLLAEYGLCCAGKDGEGDEGAFLKFSIKHLLSLDVKLKSNYLYSLSLGDHKKSDADQSSNCVSEDLPENRRESNGDSNPMDSEDLPEDPEREKVELGIDNALDQSFFCLYGLNLKTGLDSSNDDDLATHKNTNRGDLQTKEQCADVFQYILPYVRASSRTGIVKLRKVLRAIRKHFPQPPDDVLARNTIHKFLEDPELSEDDLCEAAMSEKSEKSIISKLNPMDIGSSSDPYLEVYNNLYYIIAQAEEMSATDKIPGFVLNKEGEEFVEQSANLFKYDLMYNPLRFDSWQKLANVYDEEVDLLLNDGSKHINAVDWKRSPDLPRRVELGRSRSRRCLLVSLALAGSLDQRSQVHELLGLVYYDSLQNVVPFYDQRSVIPTKDANWRSLCENSMKHFEKAFSLKPDWLHVFYLGKICEKMGYSSEKVFSYYSKAIALNPSAVDPLYRLHASRIKLLSGHGSRNFVVLRTVASYPFNETTAKTVSDTLGWDLNPENCSEESRKPIGPQQLEEAWHLLYDDCISGLQVCTEGELKHFHRARYRLAQGLYKRGENGDLERAKEELGFCFRSSRSSFTINMWEIDSIVKKGKKKPTGPAAARRSADITLPESSRKFITCIRKYVLFYTFLLEKSKDWSTLERAYSYIRTDKRFSLCLVDIVPVVLGRYVKVLSLLVNDGERGELADPALTLDTLLERLFNVLLDHVNQLADLGNPPEVNCPELSESSLYGYMHQFIHHLEIDTRIEMLESMNEKIRKRFKTPKLSNVNLSIICKHASISWCRSILLKLAAITATAPASAASATSDSGPHLVVDLHPEEIFRSALEGSFYSKSDEERCREVLTSIKEVNVKQASEQNMDSAAALLRSAYNFFRDSSCGTFLTGIRLYTISLSPSSSETVNPQSMGPKEEVDLSVPRKLLLWAYTLVHGHYSSISTVVKFCEDNVKSKTRKGLSVAPPVSSPSAATLPPPPLPQAAGEVMTAEEAPPESVLSPLDGHQLLHQCSSRKASENISASNRDDSGD